MTMSIRFNFVGIFIDIISAVELQNDDKCGYTRVLYTHTYTKRRSQSAINIFNHPIPVAFIFSKLVTYEPM